jgi:hypothetical protein
MIDDLPGKEMTSRHQNAMLGRGRRDGEVACCTS